MGKKYHQTVSETIDEIVKDKEMSIEQRKYMLEGMKVLLVNDCRDHVLMRKQIEPILETFPELIKKIR